MVRIRFFLLLYTQVFLFSSYLLYYIYNPVITFASLLFPPLHPLFSSLFVSQDRHLFMHFHNISFPLDTTGALRITVQLKNSDCGGKQSKSWTNSALTGWRVHNVVSWNANFGTNRPGDVYMSNLLAVDPWDWLIINVSVTSALICIIRPTLHRYHSPPDEHMLAW